MYSLQDVLEGVRRDLRDFYRSSQAKIVWDGVATRFTMPDVPIVDGSLVMTITTGDATTETSSHYYEVNNDSGELFLTPDDPFSIPNIALNSLLRWQWQYTRYADGEIIALANAAVRWVGRGMRFKVMETFDTDLLDWEYDVGGDVEVDRVELRCIDSEPWRPTNRWETQERTDFDPITGEPTIVKAVKFRSHPGIQKMRVHMRTRAAGTFTTDDPAASQFLFSTGLPETALDPVVACVVWQVLQRTLNYRSRDDAAQHQKQEGAVTMRDLETRVQASKVAFDIVYEQFRDEYTFGRIVS